MSWEEWLVELADEVGCDIEDILEIRKTPRELYEKGCTIKEASDFLRMYCSL